MLCCLLPRKLRQRDVTKFHVHLAVSLTCMLVVFMAGIDRTENIAGCVTVGVLLHYFLLVSWMWMGAEALLLFQKLVLVFMKITTKHLIIISIVCWGEQNWSFSFFRHFVYFSLNLVPTIAVPCLPVISSVAASSDFYITPVNNKTGGPGLYVLQVTRTSFYMQNEWICRNQWLKKKQKKAGMR